MKKHQLYLDFPESTNEGILRIEDSSIFTTAIPVNCLTLEITPPGYSSPTVITGLSQNFKLYLNACNMGMLVTGCDEICPILPDGIYNIRLSVSPNSTVYAEYNLLRITCTMNKWYKVLCWINRHPCSPSADTLTLIRELQVIHSQLLTAKHLCEDLHKYDDAIQMLLYAKKKISELEGGCPNC